MPGSTYPRNGDPFLNCFLPDGIQGPKGIVKCRALANASGGNFRLHAVATDARWEYAGRHSELTNVPKEIPEAATPFAGKIYHRTKRNLGQRADRGGEDGPRLDGSEKDRERHGHGQGGNAAQQVSSHVMLLEK